jgi:glycosyltransferase involved in cell wall biosynthesis
MEAIGKNVLYISYDGMTDPLGQAQVLPYLIGLKKLGHQIFLLSAEKHENYSVHASKIQQICSENQIQWHPIFYRKKPPVLSTILDIKTLWKNANKIILQNKIQIVHCRSYISALIGLKAQKKLNCKFIFDMRGFWADERVDGKIWNIKKFPFNLIYKFFKQKENEFLQNADAIVSLTYHAKNEINSWEIPLKSEINVIPCCADLEHFDYQKIESNNNLKLELGIQKNEFVLGYLGSIGTWYLLDEMLDFFKVLLQKRDSKFIFITKDNPKEILQAASKKNIPENKIIIHPSERENLPNVLSILDASIFFIIPSYSKKASSPTKQAELLGMGIPLICNANVGDTNEILEKENVALVLQNLNPTAYQNCIEQLPLFSTKNKSDFRKIAYQYFSLEEGIKKYHQIWNSL